MRKKSIKTAARQFRERSADVVAFVGEATPGLSKKHVSWIYDYAVIALYREFEALMEAALVGAVNIDTSTLSLKNEVTFPEHLSYDVSHYLVTKGRPFDFHGRSGLIDLIKKYVPNGHYLLRAVRRENYRDPIDELVASHPRNRPVLESVAGP